MNHNGQLKAALELVEIAASSGADAVKFQTFCAEALVTKQAALADYQKKSVDDASQLEMLKLLELSHDAHFEVKQHCEKLGIDFMSTPFDLDSARFLVEDLKVERLKVASGELCNAPLLLALARTGLPLIVSTGMSSLGDIEQALGVIAFGYLNPGLEPASSSDFADIHLQPEANRLLAQNVVLLHCTTEYPAPFADINLNAMNTMKAAFGLPVGLSDHSVGIAIAHAAVAMGATCIEKHFTVSRSLPGPDHKASLEPGELAALVAGIRQIEQGMGSSRKLVTLSETGNRRIATKSLVAAAPIHRGDKFTAANLTAKRPGGGIPPIQLWDLIGRSADRDYAPDQMIVI